MASLSPIFQLENITHPLLLCDVLLLLLSPPCHCPWHPHPSFLQILPATNITAEFLQGQQGRISSNERYKISVQREWNMVRRLVIAIAVPLVVVALLCGLLLACQCSRHIDRVTNMLYYQRKRAQGKPTNGQLSVVVTDIQGFTHLTEAEPDAMAKVCNASTTAEAVLGSARCCVLR